MGKVQVLVLLLLSVSFTWMVSGYGEMVGAAGRKEMVGGRKDVKDVKANKEVQELGEFSVRKFNQHRNLLLRGRGNGAELVFLEVVEAQVQVVGGLKYYLKVEVKSKEGETKIYDSVVVVKPWLSRGSRKLLSFAPSGEEAAAAVLNLITERKM